MSRRFLPVTDGREERSHLNFGDEDDLRTVDEAASQLRLSSKTIRRLVHGSRITAYRVGTVGPNRVGKILIPQSAIDRYLTSRMTGPDPLPPPPRERRPKATDQTDLRKSI